MFNEKPQQIIPINRVPLFFVIIGLMLVTAVFMYKSQLNQKGQIIRHKPKASMDISTKTAETGWFNDDRFKNMHIPDGRRFYRSAREMRQQVISNEEENLKNQEIKDRYATQLEIQKLEEKNLIEEKKLELLAMKSPLSIDVLPPPGALRMSSKKSGAKFDLSNSINELEDMVKAAAGGEKLSLLPSIAGGLADLNNQDAKSIFLKKADDNNDYLEESKTNPRSKYEVKAGTYIPAALITGINSDLPGSVSAQVTENIYDTISGNYLLIPQGARLVGEYNSHLSFGQQRVQVVWDRIIFPDGKNLNIQKMQGVDTSGDSGFHDKVDNHYLRIYGNAVLLSLMGGGYDILNQKTQQNINDPRGMVAANVGQKLSEVSAHVLERNMDIQPTLIISPGYKFKIFVLKDMVLENISDAQGTLAYTE